jgi:predicted metal-dependent peptidase
MHVARLLREEPFFAALSRTVDKSASTAIPTAGVRVNPETGYFEMLYNPEFFQGLTDTHRRGVLIHEFYHLVFEHVLGRKFQDVEPLEANICYDLAINSLIGAENLPENACIPGSGPFVEYPPNMTAEWYKNFRKKQREEKEKEEDGESQSGEEQEGDEGEEKSSPTGSEGLGEGEPGSFDDHEGWGGDCAAQEIAKERLNQATKKAASEAAQKGWGSVSGECKKTILERITTKLDWKKVLRYFVKTSQRAKKSSTVKRINRRYAYIHPGRKVNRTAKIAVSIDQSGSVSDTMLAAFFSELSKLAELAEFTVIPFDTAVAEDKVFVWKKGEKRKRERVLHGGTCFDAPTEYVNKGNWDGHIVLTDMCAPKPKASACQRMWMTDSYNARNPYFKTNEKVIAVD